MTKHYGEGETNVRNEHSKDAEKEATQAEREASRKRAQDERLLKKERTILAQEINKTILFPVRLAWLKFQKKAAVIFFSFAVTFEIA